MGLSGPGNGRSIWRARARRVRGNIAFTVRVNARRRVDAYGDRGGRAPFLSLAPAPHLFASIETRTRSHRHIHPRIYTGHPSLSQLSLHRVTVASGVSSRVFPSPRQHGGDFWQTGERHSIIPELRGVENEGFSSFAFSKYDFEESQREVELPIGRRLNLERKHHHLPDGIFVLMLDQRR